MMEGRKQGVAVMIASAFPLIESSLAVLVEQG